MKRKKQKIKNGIIVSIRLKNDRFIFGRLIMGLIKVYDFVVDHIESPFIVETIFDKPVLFITSVYDDVITNGVFEIVGFENLMQSEIENLPPRFYQDIVDIKECKLYWQDGRERKVSPQECVGLEKGIIWEAEGLIERIDDHYSGRKNFYVELNKVILSKDDPRYLPPPQALRWDFEKQEFYRTDR